MSLWWSFVLTVFGAGGMLLAYRSYSSYVGPIMGIAIQSVWIAYGIASAQWWFIVGAFIYGGSHIYGVRKRIRERVGGTMQGPASPGPITADSPRTRIVPPAGGAGVGNIHNRDRRDRRSPRTQWPASREIDLEIFPPATVIDYGVNDD